MRCSPRAHTRVLSQEDVINWQFLMHDPGECSTDPADWQPDDEPVRPPLDSWGRGSVPSRIVEIPVEEEEGNLVEVEKMKPPLNLAELVCTF